MVKKSEYMSHLLHRKYIDAHKAMMLLHVMPGVMTRQQAQETLQYVQKNSELHPFLFHPIDFLEFNGQFLLLYEDFTDQSLQQLLSTKLSLNQVLQISIAITVAIENLHHHSQTYGLLNPAHIFVNPQTLDVKLLAPQTLIHPTMEKSWVYMAPEQTGRNDQHGDERVDLYALGALLYEMIVGMPLFEAETERDYIFDILTKQVDSKVIIHHSRMPILASIVQKLIAKNAAERYQTASSLKYDLIRVLEALGQDHYDVAFTLAEMEHRIDTKIDGKLYGRDTEKQLLERAFQRSALGESQIVFLVGASGMGKSSLAKTIMEQVFYVKGYFVEGKFDPLKKQHTFEPIVAPFRELLKQVYLAGETEVEQFKLGIKHVDLIIMDSLLQLIPELSWFIEPTSKIIDDREQAKQQIYSYIFASLQKILSIFSIEKRPIVFFIDDLQWADDMVIDLFKKIYAHHEQGYLLFIVAHRDDELCETHRIQWQKEVDNYSTIRLSLLDMAAVKEWVVSLLGASQNSFEIAHFLARMTQGNPYFIAEAFRTLLQTKALYYDISTASWHYDLKEVNTLVASERLSDFITHRIDLLEPRAKYILQMASCFGQTFEFHLLLKLLDMPYYDLLSELHTLMEHGFIRMRIGHQRALPDEKQLFQFVHDGVQQAVYNSLNDEEHMTIHFSIGKLLQKENKGVELLEEIVRQLNYCKERLNAAEHEALALWNHQLGVLAKSAGLVQNARYYLLESLALLPVDCWERMRIETLQIYMDLAECEGVLTNVEASNYYMAEALAHTQTKLEKLRVYCLMTLMYQEHDSSDQLFDIGFSALELCNMKIPRSIKKWDIVKEFAKLKWELHNKTNEDLLNLSPIENEEMDVLMQVMIAFGRLSSHANISAMLFLRMMRLQLKYGASTHTPIVYCNYALMLISGFDDVEGAMRFGNLAKELADQSEDIYIKARVYFVYSVFLQHWERDLLASIELMRDGQLCTNELGMHYITTAHSCFLCNTRFLAGDALHDVQQEILLQQQLYGKHTNPLADDFLAELNHWIEAMQRDDVPRNYDRAITLENEVMIKVMHYVLRMQMAYFFNDRHEQQALVKELERQQHDIISLPIAPYYYFFRALHQFDRLQEEILPRKILMKVLREIKESLYKFKLWSEKAPHQYEHLYMLLVAENEQRKRLYDEAMLHYDRAIQLSKIYHYLHHEAIIYERAARFYRKRHEEKKTQRYIAQSIKKIRLWGAPVIAERLVEAYMHYIFPQELAPSTTPIDTLALFEATQSLAQETTIEEIYERLLTILMKQANATAAHFIKHRDGVWCITASMKRDQELMKLDMTTIPLSAAQLVMIYEADQLEQTLILRESTDEKIRLYDKQAKTLICMAIQYKGKTTAFLYLENCYVEHVFQVVDMDILRQIALQLLIAVENAEVYNELEERVNHRTQELEARNLDLQVAMERLEMSEQERKQLLQSVSHELRSPITSTLGYIEAILDGVANDEQQQKNYLQRSKERLLGLNELIRDLFDLAKLEAGRLDFHYTQLSTQQLYDALCYSYADDVAQAGLQYATTSTVSDDRYVVVDIKRIEQAFINLMTNAIKYTDNGHITFKMSIEEDVLVGEIEDSGIGIPAKDLPYIFQSNYRASNSHHRDSHGIGLAICKKIIEEHRGNIDVTSSENVGTCFRFTLPLEQERSS